MSESEMTFIPEVGLADPERCSARIQKGGSAADLPRDMLVLDTGQPSLPPTEMRSPKTVEEADELYRWTIRSGMVDHHGIDAAVMELPEGAVRRCATKMVADFPSEVVDLIKKRSIRSVGSHSDSDLDSVSSLALAEVLVEKRDAAALPSFAKRLGDFVNLVDYGRYEETDPDKVAASLMGYFGALKSQTVGRMGPEITAVWRNADIAPAEKPARAQAVSDRYHGGLIRHMFAVFDACAKAESAGIIVDFGNLDAADLKLPVETAKLLAAGKELVRVDFDAFNKEFEQAERTTVTIKTKEGKDLDVSLLVFGHTGLSPLQVTNMAYTRMPPETIVAVYAGQERTKGGDCYDIGIKLESLALFDVAFLEIPLNKAEAAKRAPILAKLRQKQADGTISPDEAKRFEAWTTLRTGKEYLGHGDPTVAVAGGSLVAASKTSLLSSEEFRAALMNAFRR